jgi:hypothetical protein
MALLLLNAAFFAVGWFVALPKGWAVLADIASIGAGLGCLFFWFVYSVVFGQRFQFSLRSLFILAIVVAIPCGWLRSACAAARRQREAVAAVKRFWCGEVTYDFEADEYGQPRSGLAPRARRTWVVNRLGDDFFAEVVGVGIGDQFFDNGSPPCEGDVVRTERDLEPLKEFAHLRYFRLCFNFGYAVGGLDLDKVPSIRHVLWLDLTSTKVTDASLNNAGLYGDLSVLYLDDTGVSDAGLGGLKEMRRLEQLTLRGARITDVAGERLEGLTHLKGLALARTRFGDAGLAHLAGLARLEWLELEDTQVSDVGLQHIKAMNEISDLNLCGTGLTDAGMQYLSGLRNITKLNLARTKITDAGLRHLKDLRDIRFLDLSDTAISGTGLTNLMELSNLKELYLSQTRVSDDSLKYLKHATSLRRLGLQSTQLSDAAAKNIRDALPNCVIALGRDEEK